MFVHLSVDGLLCCFCLLVLMTNAALNVSVKDSFKSLLSILWSIYIKKNCKAENGGTQGTTNKEGFRFYIWQPANKHIKPGMLQSTGLQRIGHDIVTEQHQQG